jgi:hypothetical protein
MTFSSSYAFEQISSLPDYQNTYGTGTNFGYQQVNGSWGAPFVGTRNYANVDSITHWYSGRPGMSEFDGVMVPYQAYPDNVKDLFQTGQMFDNSLNITAGNERSVLSVTATYTKNDGFVPNTSFDRFILSAGGNTELQNGFIIGANLSYTNSVQHAVQSGVGAKGANNQSAFARALYLGRNWDVQGQPFQNPVDLGSEFMVARGQADNPYWSYENAGAETNVSRIVAQISLGYDITDWFNLSYKLGFNTYSQFNKDFIRPGSTGAAGLGRVTTDDLLYSELESNLIATFTKDISEDFSFRGILGQNINQRTLDRQAVQGTEYVVFDIDQLDNTNNVIPFGNQVPQAVGFQQRRLIGLFFDLNFGYKNWAFLTITGRNDWSSTLPKGANSFFYPAITGSVVLTDALGMNSSALTFLKLRAGWSQVGNDTAPYSLQPVYFINNTIVTSPNPTAQLPFTPSGGQTVPGATLENTERDPNLKPETTSEYEFGFDSRWVNDRISLDITYYKRRSFDQIANMTLPDESGFTSFFTNFGVLSNEGIEIGLGLTPVRSSSGFLWDIFGTFTHNKNVVEELIEGVEEIQLLQQFFSQDPSAVLRPGEEYGLLKGTVNDRDQDGNLLIDPANGELIFALEEEIIGNPNPDFLVGITNTFSFKGFTLNAVFDWRQGGDLFSNTIESLLGRGVLAETEDREMNVILPGVYGDPNTHEPIRSENGEKIPNQTMIEVNRLWFGNTFAINGANEWVTFDATVFRLREVSLAYDFPKKLLESTPFGAISLSVVGRNLWFTAPNFPKSINFDPEINQFGSTNTQGIEYGATPSVRRFAFNLRVSF